MAGIDWTDWTDTFLLALELSGVEVGMEFSLEQAYKLEPILKKFTQRIPISAQKFVSNCKSCETMKEYCSWIIKELSPN
jgi:hypothetical protein